jgi:hypothetical protein
MSKRQNPHDHDAPVETSESSTRDMLFVYGEDQAGSYGVIRQRETRVELGRIRPIREGQPITGELVQLKKREEHERLFDVEVLYDDRARQTPRAGPAQVASDAYRSHWEQIFGRGATPSDPGHDN